jgi:MFS family permease
MRLLSGVSQAAAMPIMYSLINDYFPANKRGTANSTLMAASWAGLGACGMSIVFITMLGWRQCYRAYGTFSIILGALAMLFIREPKRGQYEP